MLYTTVGSQREEKFKLPSDKITSRGLSRSQGLPRTRDRKKPERGRRRPIFGRPAKKRDVKTMTEPGLVEQLQHKRGFLQHYLKTPPERKPGLVPRVKKAKRDIGVIKEELRYRKYFRENIPGVTPEEGQETLRKKFMSPGTTEFEEKERPRRTFEMPGYTVEHEGTPAVPIPGLGPVVAPEEVMTVAEKKPIPAAIPAAIGAGILLKLLFF